MPLIICIIVIKSPLIFWFTKKFPQKQTIFDWRLSLFSKGLKWPIKGSFLRLATTTSEDKPPSTHTRVLQDFSLTSLTDLKHFTMVFWKFTVLFNHRQSFFLRRENQYGSSMIQCIYQISTQSFGKDLMVVIVWLRSAEAILKRVKSVNHCCTERISMHCYSDPHFSTVLANDSRIR